jgi:hypothetical protein
MGTFLPDQMGLCQLRKLRILHMPPKRPALTSRHRLQPIDTFANEPAIERAVFGQLL